jgi:hypothetical protein
VVFNLLIYSTFRLEGGHLILGNSLIYVWRVVGNIPELCVKMVLLKSQKRDESMQSLYGGHYVSVTSNEWTCEFPGAMVVVGLVDAHSIFAPVGLTQTCLVGSSTAHEAVRTACCWE